MKEKLINNLDILSIINIKKLIRKSIGKIKFNKSNGKKIIDTKGT